MLFRKLNSVSVIFLQAFSDLSTMADSALVERKMNEMSEEIMQLWTALMGYEMQLVDQLEV